MPAFAGMTIVDVGAASAALFVCAFLNVRRRRVRTLSFNAATVDITDQESAGRWRELLEGAGSRPRASPPAVSSEVASLKMPGLGLAALGAKLDETNAPDPLIK